MIRKATQEDSSVIKQIMDENVHPTWSAENIRFALERENNLFNVYTENGDITGYICIESTLDEGELTSIAVKKEVRRKGIATALLGNALISLQGIKKLFLEVESDNTPAIRFYEKSGFKNISVRKKYYGENDAIIMEKEL